MKRIRPTTLMLPSGLKIRLAFATCLGCRRLVGTCADAEGTHIWDAIGFTQLAKLRFTPHDCAREGRRDGARDAKMEADRGGPVPRWPHRSRDHN